MRIGFRNVHGEIRRILDGVISIRGQPHQISAAALHLYHVADRLLKQVRLRQDADNKCPVFNQRDGSMLEFSGSISL